MRVATVLEQQLYQKCSDADYNFAQLNEDTIQFITDAQNSKVLLLLLSKICSPYMPQEEENNADIENQLALRTKVLNILYDLSEINQYGTFLLSAMPDEMFQMLASNLLAAKEWCVREAEKEENANSAMSNEMKKAVNDDLFLIMSIMNKFISDDFE